MRARPTAILISLILAATATVPAAVGSGGAGAASDGPTAQVAKKKCKKGFKLKKGKCRKKKGPNPYVEGQPCDPARDDHYAKYGFLCLPQPQPDGTAPTCWSSRSPEEPDPPHEERSLPGVGLLRA